MKPGDNDKSMTRGDLSHCGRAVRVTGQDATRDIGRDGAAVPEEVAAPPVRKKGPRNGERAILLGEVIGLLDGSVDDTEAVLDVLTGSGGRGDRRPGSGAEAQIVQSPDLHRLTQLGVGRGAQ